MKFWFSVLPLVAAFGFVACGGADAGAEPTQLPPTPTEAPTPDHLTFQVSSPVAVSADANALATGIDPGTSCSITYKVPSGSESKAEGLETKPADGRGRASWTWNIGPSTRPGEGSVSVKCGEETATAPITIR